MSKKKSFTITLSTIILIAAAAGIWLYRDAPSQQTAGGASTPAAVITAPPASPAAAATTAPPKQKSLADLIQEFGSLPLADAHNHDASGGAYSRMLNTWKSYSMDRVVLFGDVSERSAIKTDEEAWRAYMDKPDFFTPYFSGFDLHDKGSLDVVRANLEKGFFGLGEIAAASTYSPVVSKVEWKANDPMDGFLPQIYELCAEYKAPILLHIDPPNGIVIDKLEEALTAHPNTIFIFGHANANNSPDNVKRLLEKHPNLYADFFAGFTVLSPQSTNKLEDFIPVMKQFPDRFMLSTDSGYGLSNEAAAILSMYRVLDALGDPDVARKIAYENLDTIIRNEPATKTQKDAILKQDPARDTAKLSKLEAGRILWEKGK
ncbi:amidohydrolase family protein [Paenibacillus sp. SI8]|uniref:amidohydrolase family protein n=1 Tax=unclassified Paenibacillus TaxID=185978 RepID=UPI00346647FA